jgi:hypothetical protein
MRQRCIEPEWLDQLPPEEARARRSRSDLRRINAWMGHAWIIGRRLQVASRRAPPSRIIDLGSGDGWFLVRILRHLRPPGREIEVWLLDQKDAVDPGAMAGLKALGFRPRKVQAEAMQGLRSLPSEPGTWVVGNLFFHHFAAASLEALLAIIAERADLCLACEPRRNRWSRVAARFLWMLGANDVTRHDAVVSVAAGFRDRELTDVWPSGSGWSLTERSAGLFSHLFLAQRS